MNHKNIHIGTLIKQVVDLKKVDMDRIIKFFKLKEENEVIDMFFAKTLEADCILQWCKLLEYNFFLTYHMHLQLYAPSASTARIKDLNKSDEIEAMNFKKNIYTTEIKEFVVYLIRNNIHTTSEIISRYNIPKTTLYKWLKKMPIATNKNLYNGTI